MKVVLLPMKSIFISLLVAGLAQQSRAAADTVTIATGSVVNGYFKAMEEPLLKSEALKLVYLRDEGMSADSAVLAVASKKAEVGFFGNSWKNLELVLADKKIKIANMAELEHVEIGQDRIIFITHKGGPKILTQEQIKKILLGEVKNWKDAGGADLAVQLVLQQNTPATQKFISEKWLGGGDIYRRGIKSFGSYDELTKYVGETPGAFSFVPPTAKLSDVSVPQHPELSKSLTMVTLGAPSAKALKIAKLFEKLFGNVK